MPPAAILDIDGTLVDSNYQHALAWYRAFRDHGIVLPLWRIHRHIGMGGDQLVAALAGEGFDREQGDDVRAAEKALYMALIDEVRPLEGARELVVLAQRAVPGERVVVVGVDERAVDVEDRGRWHARLLPRRGGPSNVAAGVRWRPAPLPPASRLSAQGQPRGSSSPCRRW